MKLLNGSVLAEYIKERQAKAVRSLIQSSNIVPKLSIVQVNDNPVINTYIKLKKKYGAELGVVVENHLINQSKAIDLIKQLNNDEKVHGIIVQLPLEKIEETDKIVNEVIHSKDVDALAKKSDFDPATPMAILWLLAGYNIELKAKKIAIIGRGKLVGKPLEIMLSASGLEVVSVGRDTENLTKITLESDIIITATGNPNLITPEMLKKGAVVVDAGVASEAGKTVGDLSSSVYAREDLILTPTKGGVGPLTVCALFENVIKAAQNSIL